MASYTVHHAKHATLTSTTADTVTFDKPHHVLAVTNREASAVIYFSIDESALNTVTTAVAAADDTYVVLPGTTKTINPFTGNKVSVVGSGDDYSVEVW